MGDPTIPVHAPDRPSHGPCIDVFAPGLNILLTFSGTDTATATLSGTSMASPHVAGLLAYLLSIYPSATFDPVFAKSSFPSMLTQEVFLIGGAPAHPDSRSTPECRGRINAHLPPFGCGCSLRHTDARRFEGSGHHACDTGGAVRGRLGHAQCALRLQPFHFCLQIWKTKRKRYRNRYKRLETVCKH
jgi:hypothetical protein